MLKIRKGLNLPIDGAPIQNISTPRVVRSVALLGSDYIDLKPTMLVKVGDCVKKGQPVFTDKKISGIIYTAPAGGVVSAINRGEKRVFQSLIINLSDKEECEVFPKHSLEAITQLSDEHTKKLLVESGMWTAIRERPFSKVPDPTTRPNSIFVTAIDTHPLAAHPSVVIKSANEAFTAGMEIIKHLTDGKIYLCTAPGATIPTISGVVQEEFAGPHPAGLVGTHIHFLDPVNTQKKVWHLNYQDVIAFGRFFLEGQYCSERVISLAGPQVVTPRLIRTRLGASIADLCTGQLKLGENRIISGSVLSGRLVQGVESYLGRYHLQITVIKEGRERGFLEYLSPGLHKHSIARIYLSKLFSRKKFAFTSTTNGSQRAMVPIGSYEKIMPLDLLPTQLLRSLLVGDLETAQQLGCLELDEEDLALCTYVCPGKYEYGPILRENLIRIEQEG